jgi:hypothetical protein
MASSGISSRTHGADVILCTHTGIKWHRALPQDQHLVNVGVIGRPENDGTPRGVVHGPHGR